MLLDAIVLAGGRSSRLFGVPKAELVWQGRTLLETAVNTAVDAGSRRVVVVGPGDGWSVGSVKTGIVPDRRGLSIYPGRKHFSTKLRSAIVTAREDPPFGGPAAAVGAGMTALAKYSATNAEAVLVLACDMPQVVWGVAYMVDEFLARHDQGEAGDGVILVDLEGNRQPLAAIYRRDSLADAVDGMRALGTLDGGSMRSLIGSMNLVDETDHEGYARDVDTWSDAERFGISTMRHPESKGGTDGRRITTAHNDKGLV